MLGRYAQPTLCQHEIRVLDYLQFARSNVRPHRTCLLPTVDSALAKIRVLDFLHAQTVSPFMLCISRLNVLAHRVPPVRKSAMPNLRLPIIQGILPKI